MRHLTWLVSWLQLPKSHRGWFFAMRLTAIMSSQDPSETWREGVLCRCSHAWKLLLTERKLMHSMPAFMCSLKLFLFQTADWDQTKLDNVMRHRSSCRRRTRSSVYLLWFNWLDVDLILRHCHYVHYLLTGYVQINIIQYTVNPLIEAPGFY